jgi:hypothetical protein
MFASPFPKANPLSSDAATGKATQQEVVARVHSAAPAHSAACAPAVTPDAPRKIPALSPGETGPAQTAPIDIHPQSLTDRLTPRNTPPAVRLLVESHGHPLDPHVRGFMEQQFGCDFGRVRLHTGSSAAEASSAVHAHAFTVGNHIAFASGAYSPESKDGRALLAHELAHVVQQGRPEYAAAGQGSCEQDAEDAAGSVASGNAPVVRTNAVYGTVQRRAAAGPIAGPASKKKSRLIRIERYRRSPSARAFFEDGSNEEVTFVDGSSLDPAAEPEGTHEKVMNLTVDRSSSMRPHVELASHSSGSKVKVVTRLSPADRISKLPAKVRAEVSEAFLSDPENVPNPETMEFAADMGDRLKETSSTTKIEMEGRDPQTVARMQTVDQWTGEQQSNLDKLDTSRRGKFTHLLSDIRQVGVTGPAEAEDLSAQDIELVLAGAAGGQSEFSTFDEFKRGMEWRLRSGRISLPEEAANNPDFFMRNEYRKAWKAEAAGLRRMSRIARAAQAAPFLAVGGSAVVGAAGAVVLPLAAAGGESASGWLAARGISARLLAKYAGTSLFASNAANQYVAARDEAKAAGMDPNSPSGIASTASTAVVRASGGKLYESISGKSIQTGSDLNQSVSQRILGAAQGGLDLLSAAGMVTPESPGGLPAAADSRAAKAGTEAGEAASHPDPATNPDLPNEAAPSGAKRSGINWNPFRGKSLSEYLPSKGNAITMSRGKDPVVFKGLVTTAKGGRVWVSTDAVDHFHIEDLATQLMRANPGNKIEIITGTHGGVSGYLAKESKFLLEDYGIAPASKDLTFHDSAAISNADLKSILLSDREVILAWCDSEFTRRIVVALGMNLKNAPF